ncbi:MAG: septum formation initiator family protein [Patescibacteria group bacterium]
MREFQARKKQYANWQKIIHSKWFLIVLCVLVFFLSRGLLRMYGKYREVRHNFDTLHADMDHLQNREKELNRNIRRINGVEGRDYEIRKKLDVVKPGEKVLYIMDTP